MSHIEFISLIRQSIKDHSFLKLTFAKPKPNCLYINIYAKIIVLKGGSVLQIEYRTATQSRTENMEIEKGIQELEKHLGIDFLHHTLFTSYADYLLFVNKKQHSRLVKQAPTTKIAPTTAHNKSKNLPLETGTKKYLQLLGIKDKNDALIPSMADKFRQINKFIEIVEHQLQKNPIQGDEIHVLDMGSGKGYLTFALYDYLKNQHQINVFVKGIEMREELVSLCNTIAQECEFDQLSFETGKINQVGEQKIDILIALHACDTATDDAIFKGIESTAQLIICAPCCHKELRPQIKAPLNLSPLLKHGIVEERFAEMFTDSLRALLMESKGYKSRIFEFISNEHTRKNLMLIGSKVVRKPEDDQAFDYQFQTLKKDFNIQSQHLEQLLLKK